MSSRPADLGTKLSFVSAVASQPASLDQVFSLYRLLQNNPPALLASLAADPALASAFQAYLAAAGWSPGLPVPGLTSH